MSGQPWLASTTSGACGPVRASFSSVWRSDKPLITRLMVTFGYFCSNSLLSWSQTLLTLPYSWSQVVSVTGRVSVTPVSAGLGGATAGWVVPPGVHEVAAPRAALAPSARNCLRDIRSTWASWARHARPTPTTCGPTLDTSGREVKPVVCIGLEVVTDRFIVAFMN